MQKSSVTDTVVHAFIEKNHYRADQSESIKIYFKWKNVRSIERFSYNSLRAASKMENAEFLVTWNIKSSLDDSLANILLKKGYLRSS